MYKTVRHGENSLQYTILPQDPDSTAACTVTTTKHTTSSGRTAVLVAICVILVGSVVAAVVVPLLVSARLVLPAPHRRAFSVQNSFTITTSTTPSTTVTTIPSESAFNWSTSTISISSSEVPLNTTVKITQTESPTPSPPRVWSIVVPNTTQAPVLTSTPQFINTTSTLNEGQQRTITITNTPLTTTITNRPHKSWLPSRWPFVDPANTYARWTEFARQSALVPAACLGALVLAMIIALGACLATRRRRKKANRRRTIGKMSSELQQEDKTILLTEVSEAED